MRRKTKLEELRESYLSKKEIEESVYVDSPQEKVKNSFYSPQKSQLSTNDSKNNEQL